jgi:hypothetical protein
MSGTELTLEVTWERRHNCAGGQCNITSPDDECTETTDQLMYQCPADFEDSDGERIDPESAILNACEFWFVSGRSARAYWLPPREGDVITISYGR